MKDSIAPVTAAVAAPTGQTTVEDCMAITPTLVAANTAPQVATATTSAEGATQPVVLATSTTTAKATDVPLEAVATTTTAPPASGTKRPRPVEDTNAETTAPLGVAATASAPEDAADATAGSAAPSPVAMVGAGDVTNAKRQKLQEGGPAAVAPVAVLATPQQQPTADADAPGHAAAMAATAVRACDAEGYNTDASFRSQEVMDTLTDVLKVNASSVMKDMSNLQAKLEQAYNGGDAVVQSFIQDTCVSAVADLGQSQMNLITLMGRYVQCCQNMSTEYRSLYQEREEQNKETMQDLLMIVRACGGASESEQVEKHLSDNLGILTGASALLQTARPAIKCMMMRFNQFQNHMGPPVAVTASAAGTVPGIAQAAPPTSPAVLAPPVTVAAAAPVTAPTLPPLAAPAALVAATPPSACEPPAVAAVAPFPAPTASTPGAPAALFAANGGRASIWPNPSPVGGSYALGHSIWGTHEADNSGGGASGATLAPRTVSASMGLPSAGNRLLSPATSSHSFFGTRPKASSFFDTTGGGGIGTGATAAPTAFPSVLAPSAGTPSPFPAGGGDDQTMHCSMAELLKRPSSSTDP